MGNYNRAVRCSVSDFAWTALGSRLVRSGVVVFIIDVDRESHPPKSPWKVNAFALRTVFFLFIFLGS